MEKEVWKDIEGYECLYMVSTYGRVKSIGNDTKRNEKILKFCKDSKGYLQVCLSKDGKRKTFTIHRLVANAFIPNPKNLHEVNHKDEIKNNNFISNLEWCDAKYNSNYGTRNEKISKKVFCVEKNTIYPSIREAERQTGINKGTITSCLKGRYKTAGGYHWKYAD